jgi:hypothetical protein
LLLLTLVLGLADLVMVKFALAGGVTVVFKVKVWRMYR